MNPTKISALIFLLFGLAVTANAEVVAHWQMDEIQWSGNAGEVLDSSGNNNHGQARTLGSAGLLPQPVPGRVCNAAEFRGEGFNAPPNNQYYQARQLIEIANSASLSPLISNGEMSLSGWFQLSALGGTILHKGIDGSSREYRLHIESNRLFFSLWNRWGGAAVFEVSPEDLQTGVWYYYAVTVERLGNSQNMRMRGHLFDDIGQIGSTTQQVYQVNYTNKDVSGPIQIGAIAWGPSNITGFFDGLIDEVRLHNEALDTTDVVSFYNQSRDCATQILPVVDYRFDQCEWDGSSSEVLDSSGNELHGNSINGAQTDADGILGRAAFFDAGEDQYIRIPHDPALEMSTGNQVSVSMWIKQTTSQSGWITLLSKSDRSYTMQLSNGQTPRFTIHDGGFRGVTANAPIQLDQWYHLLGTFDGDTVRLYVDGVLQGENSGAGQMSNASNYDLAISENLGARNRYFHGFVDEVKVYDQALNASHVSTLYSNENNGLNWDGSDRDPVNCTPEQSCFADSYSDITLSTDWVTSVSSGSFTPDIVNGRLRMTEASSNQATAATLQRLIPAATNFVAIEFDYYAYGGSGADGVTLVFSDASITPRPGSFGGSLGYAQRNNGDPGFAGGWLGIGLDEFGNFAMATEGRQGGFTGGRVRDVIAVRGSGQGTNGYRYLEGVRGLNPAIDSTGSSNFHRYRIEIDSRTPDVSTLRIYRDTSGTGNFSTPVVEIPNLLDPALQQAPVPENFLLSITGSTGGSTNIHEFGNFELCADELELVGPQLDHIEIIHTGIGLTCQPAEVTLRACLDADCSAEYTDEVTLELTPDGWPNNNEVTFSGGSTTVPFTYTTPGNVTLGVASSVPTARPFSQTECIRAGVGPAPDQCTITFADTGLAFNIPNFIANRPEPNITLAAVETDPGTGQCVPAFANVTRPVQFWSTYINPDATGRPVSWPVSINASPVGQTEASATTLDLAFDDQGEAQIEVHYADAGLMQLDARYLGNEARGDVGLVMRGNDLFASRPVGFVLTPEDSCSSATENCPNTLVAATNFDVRIEAKAWQSDGDTDYSDNSPTPNYRQPAIPLSHRLIAPAAGVPGDLVLAQYDHISAIDAATDITQRLSEVGVFEIDMAPPPYFGEDLGLHSSELTARMIPADFLVSINPGSLAPYCASGMPFAYSGQTLNWQTPPDLDIEAVNAQSQRTLNYTQAGFNKLTVNDLLRIEPTADNATLNAAGNPFPVVANLDLGNLVVTEPGLQRYQFALSDTFIYEKTVSSRVAPFTPDVRIGLESLIDADAVVSSALPLPLIPVNNFDVRYGRLSIENAYGPETRELTLPFRLEYYDGLDFVTNAADSCWAYDTNTALLNPALTTIDARQVTVSNGLPPDDQGMILNAPGLGNTGETTLTWPVPIWLQDDTTGNGVLNQPSALATFGVYRGQDRIIYWREVETD